MLEQAIAFAVEAHQGQVDAAGEPYILHPLRVMLMVRAFGMDEEEQAAALLHDVVEDTDVRIADIERHFGPRVDDLVYALTRQEGEDYTAYIDRVIAAGVAAQTIKKIDLMDNLGRIGPIIKLDPAKANRLVAKYRGGLRKLKESRCRAR